MTTAHLFAVISVLLKPFKHCLIDVTLFWFQNSLYSLPVLFKCTYNTPTHAQSNQLSLTAGGGDGTILKIVYFLENYIGTDDCHCHI
jgi:hypothetical protein